MSDRVNGPVMLCATSVMKTPPIRIARITRDIVLPRAVTAISLIAVIVGALLGGAIGALMTGFQGLFVGVGLGGFAGYIIVNYSPLKGESALKWFSLVSTTKRKQIKVDGEPVVLYIGVARYDQPAAGRVIMCSGSVDVNPDEFDERGVLRSPANRNMLDSGQSRVPLRPLEARQ